MKKLSYLIISFLFLSVFIIVSCDDIQSDDKDNPEVFDIRFNTNDTIFVLNENGVQVDFIELNNKNKDYSIPDTIVIGRELRFSGRFTDNEGLSNTLVHIFGDTLRVTDADYCYNAKFTPRSNMFGKLSDTINNAVLISSVPSQGLVGNINLPIRQEDVYHFNVRCTDAAGNEDSISYGKIKIHILSEAAVIEARLGKTNE